MVGSLPVMREVASTVSKPRITITETLPPTLTRPTGNGGRRRFRVAAVFALDLAVLTLSTVVALLISSHIKAGLFGYTDLYTPIALLVVPLWVTMIALLGGYRRTQFTTEAAEYRRVLNASLLTAGILGISAYLMQYPLSRTFYFLVFVVGIPAVVIEHMVLRRALKFARARGKYRSQVLVAGDRDHIDELVTVLKREKWLGYDAVGLLTDEIKSCQQTLSVPVVGIPEHVVDAVRRTHADTVIFTEGAYPRGRDFNLMARQLETESADLIVVPSITDVAASRMNVRPVAGLPLVHIEKPRAEQAGSWLKRTIDIVGSLLLIIVSSPILAASAIAIKLEDGGPVVFKQRRVGLRGEVFECLKLRSMVTNAEEIKAKMLQDSNESDGILFKMKRDPRITRVGQFIRKFSIDEMPQFVNVLKGEMSLVGPRPALESEVAQYEPHVLRRLDVRPGLTGLWQVSGRSDLSWDDTVRLDLYYVDNWSMFQDLSILTRTVKAVFASSGAY